MAQIDSESMMTFPAAFGWLVTLAWTATIVWFDAMPPPTATWPVVALWGCVGGAWIRFRLDRSWAPFGAMAFCASILMITGGDRIALFL